MMKLGWLCGIGVLLMFLGSCQGRNSVVIDIDGESIKYDAPQGFCAMQDAELLRIWYENTSDIGMAAFYPCVQNEDIDKGELGRISSWIFLTTPREAKLRSFNMTREKFLSESQKLIGTVMIGQEEATFYGDRLVPEDFKRPTPLLLSRDSDAYAVYRLGPYFTEKDGDTIIKAKEQVAATTLIKGKVIEITSSETDFARNKSDMMLKRIKDNAKAFVEGNIGKAQSRQ